jgi:hypothetical protein
LQDLETFGTNETLVAGVVLGTTIGALAAAVGRAYRNAWLYFVAFYSLLMPYALLANLLNHDWAAVRSWAWFGWLSLAWLTVLLLANFVVHYDSPSDRSNHGPARRRTLRGTLRGILLHLTLLLLGFVLLV